MSGAGPLVGPPASSRLRSPWGVGLEDGEGLLDEGLLEEALLGNGLLCVVVVLASSQARPLPSASRPLGSLGSRSSAAWADCWEPKLEQSRWLDCATAGSCGWINCS
jgi:hypothetical protein